jgi:uncharacterized protein with PQ loop repeat
MLEEMSLTLGTLAASFGIISCIGLFLQTLKIIRRKSSANISLESYLLFFFAGLLWLLYGISVSNPYLIIPNIVALIGIISVVIVYFIYKK